MSRAVKLTKTITGSIVAVSPSQSSCFKISFSSERTCRYM